MPDTSGTGAYGVPQGQHGVTQGATGAVLGGDPTKPRPKAQAGPQHPAAPQHPGLDIGTLHALAAAIPAMMMHNGVPQGFASPGNTVPQDWKQKLGLGGGGQQGAPQGQPTPTPQPTATPQNQEIVRALQALFGGGGGPAR